MTPKFKAGDPVWAKTDSGKEVPAEVDQYLGECPGGHACYLIHDHEAQGEACEPWLRPRRDDYQQHEPLGRRQDLDKPLSETQEQYHEALREVINDLTKEAMEQLP